MTFLEKLKEQYPYNWEVLYKRDCPYDYGYGCDAHFENRQECCVVTCIECWNTEIFEDSADEPEHTVEKNKTKTEPDMTTVLSMKQRDILNKAIEEAAEPKIPNLDALDAELRSLSTRISKLEKANTKTEIPVNDCKENITPELVAELRKDKETLTRENLALKEGIARLVLNVFGLDNEYQLGD